MKCAIYTRVSTDNQAEVEFNSCEAQENKICSFINSQENMEICKVYSDPGFTGANLDRPGLQEMLQDIQNNRINTVIAYKIDRLTRSPKDFYQLIEIFEKYGVDFISVTERFDTSTPSGRLLRNIMLTFAQFERELTSERTKDKLFERAQKGMWNGGNIPFGYKAVDKKLVPDEHDAKILRKIFEIFVETGSLAKTYHILKAQGIFNKRDLPFNKTHIRNILSNITYIGKIKHNNKVHQGLHQALISEDLFNFAQKFSAEKNRKLRLYKTYFLSGLVRCADCGSLMTPAHTNKKSMKRYYYYRCTQTFRQNWDSCTTRQINADRLENFIIESLKRISLDTNYIEGLILKHNFGSSSLSSRVRKHLEPLQSCSLIDVEMVQNSLKDFAESITRIAKNEQEKIIKKFISSIVYSKNSIQINWLCSLQPVNSQSLKNPDPVLNPRACGWARATASPKKISLSKESGAILKDSAVGRQTPPMRRNPKLF